MRKNLLLFELRYFARRPSVYITVLLFFALAFSLGITTGITFPNVFKNSSYEISYLTGILSIAAVGYITLFAANTMVREKDTQFDVLLFATPVSKTAYLAIRFFTLFMVCSLCFLAVPLGIYAGNLLANLPPDKTGPFDISYYLHPFLVMALPNILTCSALLCGVAWLTRNRLMVYLTGLLIYVLYVVGSIYANSPLMAGAIPPTPAELALAAKLDPFGLAAFFEQTRYWTAAQRNATLLSFSGHLQLNRLLWCGIALIVLLVTHRKFVFRPGGKTSRKNPAPALSPEPAVFRRVQAFVHSLRHNRQVFTSYLVTDLLTILKSIPFLLMGALWIVLLSIETYSALHGDPRLGANYARTGLLVSTILETLPLLALPLLLFYSSELTWKSKASNFILLEKATPVPAFPVLLSRTVTLGVLALAFISAGIVLAILTQVFVHYPVSDPLLYLSLFYYAGWPFVLTGCCLLLLQRIIPNRYAGLTVAGLFLVLTNTKLGTMAGITHPLLRFANPFSMFYGDMNGFGDYPTAFHWKMVFFTAVTAALLMGIGFPGRRKRLLLAGCCAIALATGSYIFYRVDIQDPVMDGKELNDWKQQYESLFRPYAGIPQPAITAVTAQVDLYPKERNYTVQGEYLLENKHSRSIDSLLVYIPRESRLSSLDIEGAVPAGEIDRYGHCWYVCKQPMAAGEKRRMHYRFTSGWSVFHGHASFNSIIENGSFLRISRYFPQLGYQPDLEISSGIERSKRKMGPQPALAPPDSLALPSPNDAFIDLALTVSTDGDQVAVGSGSLVRQWSDQGRNFFHYTSDRPMPFRFALSSARYRVKKAMYRQIPIEIYYDARHSVNVDKLIENAKQTLAYCESAFGAYPHRVARFAEISSFTEGFAATAYPDVVYMRENAGFYNDISQSSNQDVINQLAGHELSHQWWGAAVWAPAYQEGGWILTEMLANYTALMLYRKEHGTEAAMEIVRQHLDTYLASRSYSLERPLYRTDYNSPHLAYNKGLLAMYQLEELAGEEAVNRALAALFAAHAYPNDPPTSPDLLKALYDNTPASVHTAITELFMQVILWDAKLDTVRSVRTGSDYTLYIAATVHKKKDDGTGKTQEMPVEQNVEIQVMLADGKKLVRSCPVINGHIRENIRLAAKPLTVTLDPLYKLIDEDRANNEKPVGADF